MGWNSVQPMNGPFKGRFVYTAKVGNDDNLVMSFDLDSSVV